MNAKRRKTLRDICAAIAKHIADLEDICDAENDAYENMPESFQCGERGSAMLDNIASLESASDLLNDAMTEIEETLK